MDINIYKQLANDDFSKARGMATLHSIANLLSPGGKNLLKFDEVKQALGSQREVYKGIKTVPIRKIIGSEGRYKDFTKSFLPKHEYLRMRWISIDEAHYKQVTLPPIQLYEIGGIYFVRDGNHRVSVAKSMGVEDIDAVVTSLETQIQLHENMNTENLRTAILEYEKEQFYLQTNFLEVSGGYDLRLTSTGQYRAMLDIIRAHKHYLENKFGKPMSIQQGSMHWFLYVFYPLVRIIQQERIVSRFPKRTVDDLFMWIYKHRAVLQEQNNTSTSFVNAAQHFSNSFGKPLLKRLVNTLKRIFSKT